MSRQAFANSVMAMMAYSNSLNTISQNVSNMGTTAYKRVDAQFKTVLAGSTPVFDSMGTRPAIRQIVEKNGVVQATGRWNDVGLGGDGFFVLNTAADGSGDTYFTRDGSFERRALDLNNDSVDEAWLVNRDDLFLMGWQADANGAVSPTTALTGMRGIQIPLTAPPTGAATTALDLFVNIPAGATTQQIVQASAIDPNFAAHPLDITFTPDPNSPNTWTAAFSSAGAAIASPPVQLVFNGRGELTSPTAAQSIDVTWANGTRNTIAVNFAAVTQINGPLAKHQIVDNGVVAGSLTGVEFNKEGFLLGKFSNGLNRNLYQLPIANFINPNVLKAKSGNLFKHTAEAGDIQIGTAGAMQTEVLNGLETSNVELADEFTRMITTQKAYSSSAQVLKTSDEMLQLVKDLKR